MQAEELAYRARALAQAHPLTDAASAFRAERVDLERARQGMAQFAEWAATAFLSGYCVRRVEETAVGDERSGSPPACVDTHPSQPTTSGGSLSGEKVETIAAALRAGEPVTLIDDTIVVEALDRVITSEIAKRADQWEEQVSAADWADFAAYVSWWVTFGYGARAAEPKPSLPAR